MAITLDISTQTATLEAPTLALTLGPGVASPTTIMRTTTYDAAGKAAQILATSDLLDEDDFATDSATKVPSQQSTKAYIATQLAGPFVPSGGSASAPAYSFSGDTNTGTYQISADVLGFATGGTGRVRIGTTALAPVSNDGFALGTAALSWADLFFASGAVIDAGNGNAVFTHSTGVWTVSTGDLRVTTAGTNSASAVTVGGTQTLTNKTLTSPTLTTPVLGTPASGTLTNCTGLPIAGIVAAGTAGQLIRMNSGATALEFATVVSSGTWTPTVTFQTAGDVSVTHHTQAGTYIILQGSQVLLAFDLEFTPTYTTAASNFHITGFNSTPGAATLATVGVCNFITSGGGAVLPSTWPTSATSLSLALNTAFQALRVNGVGVGVSTAFTVSHIVSGTRYALRGFIVYPL